MLNAGFFSWLLILLKKMSQDEAQAEEREVLTSIYDGDDYFKQLSPTTFQYKYGEHEHFKSFLLEISWGSNYPEEKPTINMDTFYNRNLVQSVKEKIIATVNEEADQWLGSAMTYTLFECLKEKMTELLEDQTEVLVSKAVPNVQTLSIEESQDDASKKPVKKEQMTKAQKRRAWDRAEIGKGGERPRGWDWVDIVKHLSEVPHTPRIVSS